MTWQKITTILGIIIGLGTLIGFVFGGQAYMEEKYAENEDIEHVMAYVTDETEELIQMVSMNQESIQLNQAMIRQKIVQDKLDRKLDLKDLTKLKEPSTPEQYREQQNKIREYDQDIRDLERELESVDKGF